MVSNEMLSQDEIDALLKGTSDDSDVLHSEIEQYLNDMEQDAIGEIGNISFGSSATALSTLLNQKVEITTPKVAVISKKDLTKEFPHPYVAIEVTYTEGFSGSNMLVIQQSDAAIIADLMIGGDGSSPDENMGEIQLSAVQEAMNQMMGSAATSMSTVFNKKVDISPPRLELLDLKEGEGAETLEREDLLIKVSFQLKVGSLIDSNIMQLLPIHFAKELIDELMNPKEQAAAVEAPVREEKQATSMADTANYAEEHTERSMPSVTAEQRRNEPAKQASYEVKPAEFTSFEPQNYYSQENNNLDMLMDIPLQVTVELGRTKRSVKEILELSAGSIIELDKLAGEPVDILINQKIVAKGEVVVIDENFGVRVTDIISQRDRLSKIK